MRTLLSFSCVLILLALPGFARSTRHKAPHPSHSRTKATRSRTHPRATATEHHSKGKRSRRGTKQKVARVNRPRGQQTIQSDRATEIQEALIRAHYLDGEPSGVWDQRTKDAMTRFQADNGWQTTIVPDSRALIKLGLGPKNTDVINPETAVISPLAGGDAGRGEMRMRTDDTQR